jgi:hypothetical protein
MKVWQVFSHSLHKWLRSELLEEARAAAYHRAGFAYTEHPTSELLFLFTSLLDLL